MTFFGMSLAELCNSVLQKGKKEPRNEGPFVKNLDRTLATFNVCR